jgi:hypothetical protein
MIYRLRTLMYWSVQAEMTRPEGAQVKVCHVTGPIRKWIGYTTYRFPTGGVTKQKKELYPQVRESQAVIFSATC